MIFVLTIWSTIALASGQFTHVWITTHALEHLPEGDLRQLLTSPDSIEVLINGSMFPDGGYAVNDDYGEIAHWEPLHNSYRDWIAEQFDPPYSDDAKKHIAFLMGMAAHGMADQIFDALFIEAAKQHDADADWTENYDMATDVVFAGLVGTDAPPKAWVPNEVLVDLFGQHGHAVTSETLSDGQALLRLAISWVSASGQNESQWATYADQFPWSSAHINDSDIPGSPPCNSAVIAAYWQSVWRRLHGDSSLDPLVMTSFPHNGDYDHTTNADLVASRISLVFSQGIITDSLTQTPIVISDSDGTPHPTTSWMYYGDQSNVMLIAPDESFAEDTQYQLRVGPGLQTIDGVTLDEEWSMMFSTGPDPNNNTDAFTVDATEPCGGCSQHGTLALWWLPWVAVRRRDDCI